MASSTQWTWVWANSGRQWDFPGGSVVKNPPVNTGDTEMRAPSLGQKDHLEKEVATHSSILAWKILWTEEPGRLQSMWLQRVRHDLATEQQHLNKQDSINLFVLTTWGKFLGGTWPEQHLPLISQPPGKGSSHPPKAWVRAVPLPPLAWPAISYCSSAWTYLGARLSSALFHQGALTRYLPRKPAHCRQCANVPWKHDAHLSSMGRPISKGPSLTWPEGHPLPGFPDRQWPHLTPLLSQVSTRGWQIPPK